MTSIALSPPAGPMVPQAVRKGVIHKLTLAFVWLAVASGAVVFTEPAPVDVLTIGLIGLLPLVGLVRITRSLFAFICLWLVAAASAYVAAMGAPAMADAVKHTTISLYLYIAAFIFAAFVIKNPAPHTRLILNAYLWAAAIGAIAGIIGYFGIIPGTFELFTKFGRAAGTFKDPNVYGPFLIPALLYAVHLISRRSLLRSIFPAAAALFLGIAILLSFSRGAWASMAVSLAIWGYLSFVTVPTYRQRLKLIAFTLSGMFAVTCVLALAVQLDSVSGLFAERASLDQSYDYGPDGRFGAHEKAVGLILNNPLGIGGLQFAPALHPEDVHNVYYSMFLNAGWLGGFLYIIIIAMTALFGLRHALRATATQPLFLVVYAALMGNILEGIIIDTDHWRHFYLLMGLTWGLMIGSPPQYEPQRQRKPRRIRRANLIRPVPMLPATRRPPRTLRPARRILPTPAPRRRRPRLPRRQRRAARGTLMQHGSGAKPP